MSSSEASNISTIESTVEVDSGISIHITAWTEVSTISSHKIILILPGIGFHGGPYKILADFLCPHGIRVYAMDYRGHGLSQGQRGVLVSAHCMNHDIDTVVQYIMAKEGVNKVFLLGESLGTIFGLHYTGENQSRLQGQILVAPALSLNLKQILDVRSLADVARLALHRCRRFVSLVGWRLEKSSRDDAFKHARRNDSLALSEVSLAYILQIIRSVNGWKDLAGKVEIPTLLIQGTNDSILSMTGMKKLLQNLKSIDKEAYLVEGAYHTLFWDQATPQIMKKILEWSASH